MASRNSLSSAAGIWTTVSVLALCMAAALLAAGCDGKTDREVMSYFPARKGFTWYYSGFAEYGHHMTIDRVTAEPKTGRPVYEISGQVDDMSGGESARDFSLAIEYEFTRNGVIERITHADVVYPHRVNTLEMLRAPVKTGRKWSFISENEESVIAEITDVRTDPDDGRTTCTVRYETPAPDLPGGVYRETRTFKKGLGLVDFSATLYGLEEFGYHLFRTEQAP